MGLLRREKNPAEKQKRKRRTNIRGSCRQKARNWPHRSSNIPALILSKLWHYEWAVSALSSEGRSLSFG